MYKKVIFYLSLFIPLTLSAQIQDQGFKEMLDDLYNHTVPLINVDSLSTLKNVYLLDAREKDEYAVSHIKNARNVGYIWFDMRKVYDIPKDATIVIYCSVGYRSEKIGEKLIKNGYQNVFNLYGSIFEWVNEGYPIYKDSGVQTTEIHTYNKEWSKWVKKGTKIY